MVVYVVVRVIECRGSEADEFVAVFSTREGADNCIGENNYFTYRVIESTLYS